VLLESVAEALVLTELADIRGSIARLHGQL
jgi:hypothetical protein